MNWNLTKDLLPIPHIDKDCSHFTSFVSRPVLICTTSGKMEVSRLFVKRSREKESHPWRYDKTPLFIDRRGFGLTDFENIVAWADIKPYEN